MMCVCQDTAEMALRGAAILCRLLLGVVPQGEMPAGLQQAASTLHDQCLLVRYTPSRPV